MPQYKDLRFGDSFTMTTTDGIIGVRRLEHGRLELTAPACVSVSPVTRRPKTRPRMEPLKRRKVVNPDE